MHMWNINKSLTSKYLLHDSSNLILLRADLHKAFDDGKFIFCPKNGVYVAHMLQPTVEIGRMYHNVSLQPIQDCSAQMFFTRFALAIFPCLSGFFNQRGNSDRIRLVSVVENDGINEKRVEKNLSTSQLDQRRDANNGQIAADHTQKKRKKSDLSGNADSDDQYETRTKFQKLATCSNCSSQPIFEVLKSSETSPVSSNHHCEPNGFPKQKSSSQSSLPPNEPHMQQLKKDAISKQRPADFNSSQTGIWRPEFVKNPVEMYKAYGYEVVDELSDPENWLGKDKE